MAFTDKLHNRGSVSTGYDIEYSMLLNGQHTRGEITQTGGDRKTHTISFWHKRAPIGIGTGAGEMESTTNDLWGTPSEGDTLRLPIDAIRPNVYYNVIRYPSNRIWYNPYPYNYNWNYHTPIYVKPSGPRGSNTTTSGSGTNNTSPNLVRPPSKPSTPVNSGQNKINRN